MNHESRYPIYPVVHLNGTSGRILYDGSERVRQHVVDAISTMRLEWPNPRDYYVQPGEAFRTAEAEWQTRLNALQEIASDLAYISEQILEQLESRGETQ